MAPDWWATGVLVRGGCHRDSRELRKGGVWVCFSNFDKLNSRDFSFPRTNSQRGRALDFTPFVFVSPTCAHSPVLIVELGDTFRDYLRKDRLSCDMSLGARRGL